jgi:hypothetical protein
VRAPLANSLAPAIYDLLPNDTDFSVFRDLGLPGLNFAIVGSGAAYHTAFDTPAHLDPGTVQRWGDTMLALVRALASADLRERHAGDAAFFDVLGISLVRFPARYSLPLAVLAFLLALAALASLSRGAGGLAAPLLGGLRLVLGMALAVGLALVSRRAAAALLPSDGFFGLPSLRAQMLGIWWIATASVLAVSGSRAEDGRGGRQVAAAALLAWTFLIGALALERPRATPLLASALILFAAGLLGARARGALRALALAASAAALALIVPVVHLVHLLESVAPAVGVTAAAAAGALVVACVLALADGREERAPRGRSPVAPCAVAGALALAAAFLLAR